MKPHKCPVCDGKKPAMSSCDACEGKGVVWEPEVVEAVSKTPVPESALDLTYRGR